MPHRAHRTLAAAALLAASACGHAARPFATPAAARPGGQPGASADGPELFGPGVFSTGQYELPPTFTPDQSYLIFSSWGRPDGVGGGDLYVSFRGPDGRWSPARNLGALVNSPRTEYCPVVSPDGRTLYFASERGFADAPLGRRLDADADACTEVLGYLPHRAEVTFSQPGQGTIRVNGRRVRKGDQSRDLPVTAERTVVVR